MKILFYIITFLFFSIELPFLTSIGVLYFIFSLSSLIQSLGKKIPFIELTIFLTVLQIILSPILEYRIFHNEIFGIMKIDEIDYLSYVIPATMLFHFGLIIGVGKYEILFKDKVLATFVDNSSLYIRRGKILIFTGILFTILIKFSVIPSIGFILVLFSLLQFLGFFYLWLAASNHLPFYFGIVFIPFFLEALSSTIFINVIVWGIFLYSFYLAKNKVNIFRISFFIIFAFSFLIIFQSIKYDYRKEVWGGSNTEASSVENIILLSNLFYKKISNLNSDELKLVGSVVNVRFNQGWIISDIMKNISTSEKEQGFKYLGPEVVGILLPRFLFPNKIRMDDNNKFTEYAGWTLGKNVSMDLGIAGDGYGAFGLKGGILFCGIVGFLFGLIFALANKQVKKNPDIFIFNMLIFFYLMRAGNEFSIIANWIVKASIFTFVILILMNHKNIRSILLKPKERKFV